MLGEFVILGGICLTLYGFYKWVVKNNDFFEKRGIKYLSPYFLFGNTFGVFTTRNNDTEFLSQVYNTFPDEKVVGFFDLRRPVLAIRDPDIVKQITVKDFDYFENHNAVVEDGVDKLFGNSLFMLRGQKWRDMRSTLSPAFTGSKMRQMFELVSECADEMVQFFVKEAKSGKRINHQMKELFSKYTNDVIATCAFGIKVNSFEDPNNEFIVTGNRVVGFTGFKMMFKFFFLTTFPKLAKLFDIQFQDKRDRMFFQSMVLDTIKQREKDKIYRPDMINIMMQVRKGTINHDNSGEENGQSDGFATVEESNIGKAIVKRTWNDDEIVAQCFIFFFAGFDTTATMLTFITYELALNKEIQERLYNEIRSTEHDLSGKRVSYDILQKMEYLDQVLCEALRKWPPAAVLDRVCTKDYNFNDGDKLKFQIDRDTAIWIPTYSFHHDPKYFSNPDKFDPERFSDKNKHDIQPNTYMPFGSGPRNCIGSRFAIIELKAVLYHLLLKFSLEPNEQTQIPIKLINSPVTLTPENGIHLEFKLRKDLQ